MSSRILRFFLVYGPAIVVLNALYFAARNGKLDLGLWELVGVGIVLGGFSAFAGIKLFPKDSQ